MAITTLNTMDRVVINELLEAGFTRHDESTFYPADPDVSLVKFDVYGGQFQLFRRHRPTDAWVRIAVYDCSDFDPDGFHNWVASWPLVYRG